MKTVLLFLLALLVLAGLLLVAPVKDQDQQEELSPRQKGDMLLRQADYAGALGQYDLAIKEAPRDSSAHARRAEVLLKLSRPQEALTAIDHAFSIERNASYYVITGDALKALGKVADAKATWKSALSAFEGALPKQQGDSKRRTQLNIGEIQTRLGRYQKAIEAFSGAIKINPTFGAVRGRAEARKPLGQWKEALEDFQWATRLEPKSVDAWNGVAGSLVRLGRMEEGVQAFTKLIEMNPTLTVPYLNRAATLTGLGRNEEARRDYESVLRIEPGNPTANKGLAKIK